MYNLYLHFLIVLLRIGKISKKIQKVMIEKILVIHRNWKTSAITSEQELIVIEAVIIIIAKKKISKRKVNIIKIIAVINIKSEMISIVTGMNITEVVIITIEDVEVEVDLLSMLIAI